VNKEGLSIPFEITTLNPPYSNIVITVTVAGSPAQVQLNTTSISITKGVYMMRYFITNIDTAFSNPTLQLNFAISGTDGSSFTFNPATASLTIPVNAIDTDPASFETLSVS
jgi:hypothetical protein